MISPIPQRLRPRLITRIPLALCAALLGCADGTVEQPRSAPPAVELNVVLAAPPPDHDTEITLALREIPYCPPSDVPNRLVPLPFNFPVFDFRRRLLDRTGAPMRTPATSGGNPRSFGCVQQNLPLIRFFQPELYLLPGDAAQGPIDPWRSLDTLIAYTAEPATFQPFGPDDQTVLLPAGYSALRRTCGSTTVKWDVRVGDIDEVVNFWPPVPRVYPQPWPTDRSLLERRERALLEGCGIRPPAVDPGRRVSFDQAQSLAFSPDGQQLLFLLPVESTDPAQGAPLRSVDLAEGVVRQLAVVPNGRDIRMTESGDLYVTTGNLGRIDWRAGENASLTVLPIPSYGRPSPDGRWIIYYGYPASGEPAGDRLWNTATGAVHPVEGLGFSSNWSATSLIVSRNQEAYTTIDPATGRVMETFPSTARGHNSRLAWTADGPFEITTPLQWMPQQPVARAGQFNFAGPDQNYFGLVMDNLRDGSSRRVLDVDAGSVSYAAAVSGAAFFWARKCLGLFETVCGFDLHEVTLPSGDARIVATADSAAPVAIVVAGGRRTVAIAARDGIHVRELP